MRVVKLNKRARPACKRKGTSPRSAHRISPSPNRPVYLPSRHMKKKDEKKITRKLPNKTYFRAHLSLLRKRCTEALSARPAALARSPPCENQTTGPLHRPPSQFTALSPGHAQFRGFHPRNALRPSHGPAPGGPLYETLGVRAAVDGWVRPPLQARLCIPWPACGRACLFFCSTQQGDGTASHSRGVVRGALGPLLGDAPRSLGLFSTDCPSFPQRIAE